MTGEMFVHGIVEHFADAMVESAFVRATDIHTGLFANGFEPFQGRQFGGVVIAIGNLVWRHILLFGRVRNTRHNYGAIPGKNKCAYYTEKDKKIRSISQRETAVFSAKIHH